MKAVIATEFEIGDLYYFAVRADAKEGIWGLFDCCDAQGRPCLEVWSPDFASFGRKLVLSEEYVFARIASREELRDFAYSMGCERV